MLPLAILVALLMFVVGLKGRRRFLRRTATTTRSQIAGGWAELLDLARDLGIGVSSNRTRSEQATVIGFGAATHLATLADAAVFAPGEPTADQVNAYWASVQEGAAELRQKLGRWARWRAAVSLRSLRRKDTVPGSNG